MLFRKPRLFHVGYFLILFLLGLSWTLATPIQSSPDDDFHLPSIWCGEFADDSLCELQPDSPDLRAGEMFVEVPAAIASTPCWAGNRTQSAVCADGLTDQREAVLSRSNDGLYPGGFYDFLSPLAGANLARSVLAMRMVVWSVCFGLLIAFAKVAFGRGWADALFGLLLAATPMGLFLFASTNPSSWAIVGVTVYSLTLLVCFRGEWWAAASSLRRGGCISITVLSATLANLSRSDSALMIGISSILFLYQPLKMRRASLWPLTVVVVSGVASLFLGQISGTQSGSALAGLNPREDKQSFLALLVAIVGDLPAFFGGLLGLGTFERPYWGLGWLDTPLPSLVAVAWIGSLLSWRGSYSKHSEDRWALVGFILSVIAVPSFVLARGGYLVGQNVQPRYLLPMFMVVAFVLLGIGGSKVLRSNLYALILATVGHSFALYHVIRRFTTGQGNYDLSLWSNQGWWWTGFPVGPNKVWILGSVAFLGLGVASSVARSQSSQGSQLLPAPETK